MNRKIENITATLLGLVMIIFGLNKFIGFIALEPPADPAAQQFLVAMFSSYLYVVVAIAEIVGGLLLLIPRFRFIGWLIQAVIIFNIVAFHVAHDFIGNGIWLAPTALFLIAGYFQLAHLTKLFMNKALKVTASIFLMLFSINLFAQTTNAQTANYVSSKVENHIIIEEPAEKIWALISKVENLSLLVPDDIKKVETNGEGVYTSWLIYLQNGSLVKEEMTYFNSEEMEFS